MIPIDTTTLCHYVAIIKVLFFHFFVIVLQLLVSY
jgi:hypothetical protein